MEPGGSSINSARIPKPHTKPRVIRHGGAYPAHQPKKETGSNPKKNQKNQQSENNHGGTYKSLLPCLLNEDWSMASALLDAHPEIARQAEEVHLHGQLTVALPLHIASCLHVPVALFDKLLKTHPQATQHPDNACGRFPLHWACRSNASVHVLDKLIQTFPSACKAYDRAEDRTPLHYLAVHASNLDQITVLLRAPVNQKRILKHNDAERMTPVDLAKTSQNPIKEAIVHALLRQQEILTSHDRKQHSGAEDVSLSDLPMAVQHRSDVSIQSMPAPRSTKYAMLGSSPRHQKRGGVYPSPGAQATAFADQEIPASSSPPLPTKSPPQYRYRGTPREEGVFRPATLPLAASGDPSSGKRRTRDVTRSAPDVASSSTRQEEQVEKRAPRSQPAPLPSPLDEDEYFSKYMKKMNTEQNMLKTAAKDDEQQHSHNRDSDRSSIDAAQSLMNEMNTNIDRLEASLENLKSDLDEKESHLASLDATTAEMQLREQDLERGLRNARSLVEHQHAEMGKKLERIASLKDRIAVLRAELLEEQSTLEPMERAIMGLEEKIVDKEHKLKAHREEKGSIELMKQSLCEEKDYINREMENSNSELKSLKAIQDLAMGKDIL
jgi:hypothetical protein